MNNTNIADIYSGLCIRLKNEMNSEGFWTGELSSSALSTAVAITALKINGNPDDWKIINNGLEWLLRNINDDGGFGDTPESISNVSTTLLSYAAINYCQTNGNGAGSIKRMKEWLAFNGILLDLESITKSILRFYGKDYTFSVPILAMLTVCNVIPRESARHIPGLPFELTLLPQSLYRFFNLRVVSYALPALIGVGIFLLKQQNSKNPVSFLRSLFIKPAIDRLNKLLPESGGFLEAIPLTGFVALCLIASNRPDNKTVTKGLEFLRLQQRKEGGWPIDTDLSTWVTTLTIKALGKDLRKNLNEEQSGRLRKHILALQYKSVHPFNGAKPGGWGWTSHSGSVPDADDTPGAILALLEMFTGSDDEINAVLRGCEWLTELQNKDGGFPTFCKGWGRLPFDKSCADLTGHALLAMLKSLCEIDSMPAALRKRLTVSINKAVAYLERQQMKNGSWLPLWFGNQLTETKSNPVYGTAKVSIYLSDCLNLNLPDEKLKNNLSVMLEKAHSYLIRNQNTDGSWGGEKDVEGTIEETSLAISALAAKYETACLKGLQWLDRNAGMKASPIGLYFAMLWYDEKMYPMIYYTEACRRLLIK